MHHYSLRLKVNLGLIKCKIKYNLVKLAINRVFSITFPILVQKFLKCTFTQNYSWRLQVEETLTIYVHKWECPHINDKWLPLVFRGAASSVVELFFVARPLIIYYNIQVYTYVWHQWPPQDKKIPKTAFYLQLNSVIDLNRPCFNCFGKMGNNS